MTGLPPNAPIKDMNQTCQKMLRQLADPKGWKVGKTKVRGPADFTLVIMLQWNADKTKCKGSGEIFSL